MKQVFLKAFEQSNK
jgi:serine/threonine protein phosphatase PrpC